MEKRAFEQLMASVVEAGAIMRGQRPPARVYSMASNSVRELRESLSLSQDQFARLMHVSVKTLRNWEQDVRTPGGAAAALLTAIRNDPRNVLAALNQER